jgi:hypothetical protein
MFDGTGMSVVSQQSARLCCAKRTGVTQTDVAPHQHQTMHLPHESRHVHWCDCFMTYGNQTGAAQRGHILKISFKFIFQKKIKIDQNKKIKSIAPDKLFRHLRSAPASRRRAAQRGCGQMPTSNAPGTAGHRLSCRLSIVIM